MDRIVVLRSATLTRTFAFTPTGTPTVALTRVSDGTPVTASVMTGSSATWSYTIPASSNTLLDTYVETITAVSGGVPQTFTDYIEVAGESLFDVAELRAVSPLGDATTYPISTLIAMRTTVEQALEDACGVAFVPRYARETFSGSGTTTLLLRPRTTLIRSATVGTTALTASDIALLTYSPSGTVTGYPWTVGDSNITVGYEHGWRTPPGRVKRAAMMLAKSWLVSGPVDDRAATFSSADGGTYGLVVEGRAGSTFGIPAVDAVVNQYSLVCGVA